MLKGGSGQGTNSSQGKKNKNNDTNSNQEKKEFQGNCNYCGKFGHKEVDCHKKAVDQKNGGNEAAAAAVSNGNNVELLCAKVEYGMMATTKQVFPYLNKLLTQPTIWIGDMAAMIDMTLYSGGMINKKEGEESVSIMMGNKVMGALMKDVAMVPDCTFNLFSISKHLKEG